MDITVTLQARTPNDMRGKLLEAIEIWNSKVEADETIATTEAAPAKRGRKPKTTKVETEEPELANEASNTPAEELDFMGGAAEAPAATEKKLTIDDINEACMKYAKVKGRPQTLELLQKKFKVKSITELKPETFGKVVEALAL